jgi:hypothetical protein
METSSTLSRYETIKNAINAISESIQSDIYEIKKYIRAIEDESEYNIRSLQSVVLNDGFLQRCIYFVFGDFKKSPYLIKI